MTSSYQLPGDSADLVARRPHQEPPEFDITAMVDLVFMMNIYFLVTFITVALGDVDLPAANRASPLDADDAVIITVTSSLDGKQANVFLGQDDTGQPLTDDREQEFEIRRLAEEGAAEGKSSVLIKAERHVRLGDLFRLASASAVEGLKLNVAVREKDSAP